MSRVCVDRPQLGEIFPRWDVDENTRGPRERRRGREGGRERARGYVIITRRAEVYKAVVFSIFTNKS